MLPSRYHARREREEPPVVEGSAGRCIAGAGDTTASCVPRDVGERRRSRRMVDEREARWGLRRPGAARSLRGSARRHRDLAGDAPWRTCARPPHHEALATEPLDARQLTTDGVPRFPSYIGVRDDVAWPPTNETPRAAPSRAAQLADGGTKVRLRSGQRTQNDQPMPTIWPRGNGVAAMVARWSQLALSPPVGRWKRSGTPPPMTVPIAAPARTSVK